MDNSIINELQVSGNIYVFHAFDIGDDVDLERLERMRSVVTIPQKVPKYFKNYHIPTAIEIPQDIAQGGCISCKVHNFGVLSLIYKIPFQESLKNIKKGFLSLAEEYAERSVVDAHRIFKMIDSVIAQPKFSRQGSSYILIQTAPQPTMNIAELQKVHGETIASIVRFENDMLSEYQINEIWESAIGYFRGDLILIDTDAAFVYNDEYQELMDLVEFANIQSLELRYFDRLLDEQLNAIYEGHVKPFPFVSYIPLLGSLVQDPIERLWKFKVDVSVISERLESSIKLAGEPYLSEMYDELVENLDLKNWKEGLERKVKIVESIHAGHQHKIETNREDLISLLIVILIFIELVIGLLSYNR